MTAKCFLDGGIVDQRSAGIALSDRGFTLGDGVFETFRVRDGAVVDIPGPSGTADGGAGYPCVSAAMSLDRDLAHHLNETREANGIAEGVLRLTVTRGKGARGLAPSPDAVPTVCITAAGLPSRPDSFTAVIAARTRRNEFSPLSRIKSLGYLDNMIALGEANGRGADDAVLLNGTRERRLFHRRQPDRTFRPGHGDAAGERWRAARHGPAQAAGAAGHHRDQSYARRPRTSRRSDFDQQPGRPARERARGPHLAAGAGAVSRGVGGLLQLR